jgi:hypothetical protein
MTANLDNIIELFNKMETTGWDINSSLKYGFYFVDRDEQKLNSVYAELKNNSYILEKIYLSGNNKWTLHVSKIDILTPEKIYRRNIAFNELADYCEVELYDGWDVEKIGD